MNQQHLEEGGLQDDIPDFEVNTSFQRHLPRAKPDGSIMILSQPPVQRYKVPPLEKVNVSKILEDMPVNNNKLK